MSTARHHAEWLSLVEASGPFLSLPVLLKTFPAGLDAHDPEQLKLLRSAYEEWQDNQLGLKPEPAIHRAWVEFVLKQTLELPTEVLLSGQQIAPGLSVAIAQHNETLRPDWVVVEPGDLPHPLTSSPTRGEGEPEGGSAPLARSEKGAGGEGRKPRLLVQIVPMTQGLEKPLKGSRWAASPATRMMELLHACNVRLGLVTNGEHWMLVNAPKGETTGFISWYSTLWVEEHLTLRAFRSLLGVRRFFGVNDAETLEALLTQSLTDQQEVTDQLGYQVRRAVEMLVQAIARLDQDANGEVLGQNVPPPRLYEATLTVMMRLVFLFCAEERELLLLGDPIYDQHYAVSTLREQLRSHADLHGEEILERRSDAWCRLLATFRAVYGGIFHDRLQLPAYGGSLFDPDRFPFLEGRGPETDWQTSGAEPLRINNRIVLHLLEALQILQIRVSGGVEPRRLSFRALDIEQIGHVYEGLLDHTAVRATAPVLGLVGTRYQEPEIELAELERYWAEGEEKLLGFLKEQTGKSPAALKKLLKAEIEPRETQRLRTACNNDAGLFDRILPFAPLIRKDTLDYPIVIPTGAVYVTEGVDRRQSGTHYTPRNLTEEIVRYTLEPLVYVGVAEGLPQAEWRLRSASELLQLKICDMAMGSGAFLVQTCRYLAEKLVEAWEAEIPPHPLTPSPTRGEGEQAVPAPLSLDGRGAGGEGDQGVGDDRQIRILPDGSLSLAAVGEHILPTDLDERLMLARRLVADRCLYGVDKNPLAVEMAKLSLWLVTLQKDRPFTFLDHALKWGDSLLGITRAEQIEYLHLNPDNEAVQYPIASQIWRPTLQDAIAKRRKLESFSVNGIEDLQEKERLFQEAERAIDRLRFVGDYLIGRALADAEKTSNLTTEDLMVVSQRIERELAGTATAEESREITALKASAQRMLNLGNPANQPPRKPFHWLLEFPEVFFTKNAPKGFSAMVGNPPFLGGKRIATVFGDSYQDGLKNNFLHSKGAADLCTYFLRKSFDLFDEKGYLGLITTNTIAQGDTKEVGLDYLIENDSAEIFRAFPSIPWVGVAGVFVSLIWLCKGVWAGERILDERKVDYISSGLFDESKKMAAMPLKANQGMISEGVKIHGNGFVVTPQEREYLINLSSNYSDIVQPYLGGEDVTESPTQSAPRYVINFQSWEYEQASQYTHPFDIVTERVKPYRDSLTGQIHESKYWLFWDRREKFFQRLDPEKSILVCSGTSKYLSLAFVSSNSVLSQKLKVFAYQEYKFFAILQSNIHNEWAWRSSSTLKADLSYSNTDTFLTFPMPSSDIAVLGQVQHTLSPSALASEELAVLHQLKNRYSFLENIEKIGETYYTHRQAIMRERQEGLTKTYNRFHDANETASDIQTLRELHVEMDQAVAAAYGWQDLDLGHGFHKTKQGDRFTISETARREVLDRLLELNHQRYAEEVAQGLHDKKKTKSKGQKAKSKASGQSTTGEGPQEGQISLF